MHRLVCLGVFVQCPAMTYCSCTIFPMTQGNSAQHCCRKKGLERNNEGLKHQVQSWWFKHCSEILLFVLFPVTGKNTLCARAWKKKRYLSAGQIKCCNIFSGHLTGGLRRRFSSPAGTRSPDSAELICSHLGPLSSLSELIRAELSLSARSGAPPPSTGARCRGPPPAESLKEHLLWSSVTYKCVVGPTGCRGNKKVKECLKKRAFKMWWHKQSSLFLFWLMSCRTEGFSALLLCIKNDTSDKQGL